MADKGKKRTQKPTPEEFMKAKAVRGKPKRKSR